MVHTAEIDYSGKTTLNPPTSADHDWIIGAMYTIDGFDGSTVHVHGVYTNGDTGILAVHYNKGAKYRNSEPIVGATIRDSDGNAIATVSDFYDVYVPAQNIMGFDNPEYGLDVDITGSANMRFAEGLPQLDAWGKLRTSGATHIGDYVFGQKEILDNNFSPTQLSGGSVVYDNDRNSVTIKVPGAIDPDHVADEGFAAC
jgi:hypothetical protein